MDERTLTERVQRIEQMLSLGGGEESERQTNQRPLSEVFAEMTPDKLEMHRERAGISKVEPLTSFAEIANRIHQSTVRVCGIAANLEEIGDRVLGTLPQQAEGAGGEERKPDGMLEHTFDELNRLDHALCRLHSAAARIERI